MAELTPVQIVRNREKRQQFTRLSPGVLEKSERLEQLRALEHGFSISVVITPFDSISVDTPEDLARVRKLMEQ